MILDRIKLLCNEQGITKTELERRCGFSQNSINKWNKSSPQAESVKKVALELTTSTDYLLELTDSRVPYPKKSEKATPIKVKEEKPTPTDYEYPIGRIIRMPIIGSIAAGYNGEAHEEYIGDISFLAESLRGYAPEECFVLRVSGDSMYPELQDGDLVLIHRQPSVDSGDIAAVMYDSNDATLKRVRYESGKDWFELIPENPAYSVKRIENADLEECRILGKLIDLVSRRY